MTIVLPYPTPQGSNLADNDAGNGAPGSPPIAAPEFMATDVYNDVDRYDKTCIRQNTDNILAINAALGTMAEQDADDVAITDGTIDAAVSVAEAVNTTQFGGLTLQQFYDLEHPIGEALEWRLSNTPPTAWPGVSATWERVAENLFIKCVDAAALPGETFGGVSVTDETVLTESQIPTHDHKLAASDTATLDVSPSATELAARLRNVGNSFDYDLARSPDQTPASFVGRTSEVGGGTGHTHTYNNNPPFYRAGLFLRTA